MFYCLGNKCLENTSWSQGTKFGFFVSENLQFILSQALITMVTMLDNSEVFDLVPVNLVMSSLK